MERRLAAILSADVVGYTRLMRADEEGTLARLKACRADLIDPTIARHNGRTVKLMGDGALVEFTSVVEAVQCATEIQRDLREYNSRLPQEQRLEFRIGINLGDVIVEGDDIYGDGVNIASRLESMAEPGGVCISRSVHTQVKDKLDLRFRNMGELRLKNIQEPVSAFQILIDASEDEPAAAARRIRPMWVLAVSALATLIVVGGIGLFLFPVEQTIEKTSLDNMAFPLPEEPSVAVLPFATDDPAQEYVAEGIAAELASDLSGIPGLLVISRDSVYTYGSGLASIHEAAENLGVRYVLTGSIGHANGQLEIRARLTDAIAAEHVWDDRYDVSPAHLRSWRRGVAEGIAGVLAVDLPSRGPVSTRNVESHYAFLRGLSYFHRHTSEDNAAAAEQFGQAIRLDEAFALAHGWRAWADVRAVIMEWADSPQDALDRAAGSARAAIALDGSGYFGHWALGAMHMAAGEYGPAREQMREALKANPNDADLLAGLAKLLAVLGEADEGVALGRRAQRLNPHAPVWYHWNLGLANYYAGRYKDAVELFGRSTRLNREARLHYIASLVRAGRHAEAKSHADAILNKNPSFSVSGYIQSRASAHVETRRKLTEDLMKAGLPKKLSWECLVRPDTCR
jgi:adenylate cyclase